MPRKPSATFTGKELEIMQIVWELGEATASAIQAKLSGDPNCETCFGLAERRRIQVFRTEDFPKSSLYTLVQLIGTGIEGS